MNGALKRCHYPLHVLDDVLPILTGAKVFTICDVKNGFWHLRLEQSSRLTFGTPFGRFKWKRLPFGISPAPELFSSRLDEALTGLTGVDTIADILIRGSGKDVREAEADHDQNFTIFLRRCEEKGIKLHPEKCRHKIQTGRYSGHVITTEGLKPDDAKIAAMKNLPTPNNVQR